MNYGSLDTTMPMKWPASGPLGEYFYHHFISSETEKPTPRSQSQLVLKTSSIALIIIGQFPLSVISFKRQSNPAIQWMSTASNIFGFSMLNIWAFKKILKTHSSVPLYINIFAALGGMISLIPITYFAYSYNEKNPYSAILVLLAHAPTSIYSFRLMLDPQQKKKQALIDQLSHNENAWIQSTKSKKQAPSLLLKKITIKDRELCDHIGYFGAKSIGSVLASANTLFSGTFAFKFTQQWTHFKPMQYLVGTMAAACNAALYFKGMMGTTSRLYTATMSYFQGKADLHLSYQLQSKLSVALFFVALALNALSYSPAVTACEDNYTGPLRDMMAFLVPTGLNVMIANALADLVDELILIGLSQWGSEEKKLIIQLHNQLEALQNAIAISSDQDVEAFKQALPSIEQFCSESERAMN